MRLPLLVPLVALLLAGSGRAEDEGVPRSADLTFQFLPPPLDDARYSIGVFAADGKLIRHLHETAPENVFPAALNGLVVKWDAKDDAGKRAANGKYELRGYAVAPVKVRGVATRGNDWIADDPKLRLANISRLIFADAETCVALGTLARGDWCVFAIRGDRLAWLAEVGPIPMNERFVPLLRREGARVLVEYGRTRCAWNLADGASAGTEQLAESVDTNATLGFEAEGWKIEETRVAQSDASATVLRELPVAAAEFEPRILAADAQNRRLALFGRGPENSNVFRILAWASAGEEGGKPVSRWRAVIERKVAPPGTFDALDAAPTLRVELVKNPLGRQRNANPTLVLSAVANASGTHLTAEDGLRLRTVSTVPGVQAVALAKGTGKGRVRFFQRDRAVSEEYLLEGCDRVMRFEVGKCEINERGEVLVEEEMEPGR